MDAYLREIYYNPSAPSAYSGLDKIYQTIVEKGNELNLTKSQVKHWLESQNVFTQFKPVKRKFKRDIVYVENPLDQFDIDLLDLHTYAKDNDGYQYILVAIDIFSRFVWTEKMKTRKCNETVQNFQKIINKAMPKIIRSDKGSEFHCTSFKELLKANNIHHLITANEVKANYAERVIQTIKRKLFRYFAYKHTYNWVQVLDDIVHSYNNTIHSKIKMSPVRAVDKKNRDSTWAMQYILPVIKKAEKQNAPPSRPKEKSKYKPKPFKYKIGQTVRVSHLRVSFERAYHEKFSGEIFKISKRFRRLGKPVYTLVDLNNEPIIGTFYQPELTKVNVNDSSIYEISEIIKSRKKGKQRNI